MTSKRAGNKTPRPEFHGESDSEVKIEEFLYFTPVLSISKFSKIFKKSSSSSYLLTEMNGFLFLKAKIQCFFLFFFPVWAPAQGSLCPGGPLALPPGGVSSGRRRSNFSRFDSGILSQSGQVANLE